jgi:AcrR family transcriptional regulator
MNQNTSGPTPPTPPGLALAGVDESIVVRTAQRSLARRQAVYADEVRRLLDAGLEVMRECGTTKSPPVSDIVAAAGLSRDAFYRHFASKEDLVAAIVEAGAERLRSYLRHQMAKERDPGARLRRWIEGIMSQASNREVAHSTRAVLWNGGRVGDQARPEVVTTHRPLAELIVEPVAALGSRDPERDAAAITQATMGLMNDFLWRFAAPTRADVAHLVRFCHTAVQPSHLEDEP